MIDDRSLQRALSTRALYAGEIDGDVGDLTRKAIFALVAGKRGAEALKGWTAARLRIAAEQAVLQDLDFYPGTSDIDGLVGPNTRDAWERWQNGQRVTNIAPMLVEILAPTVAGPLSPPAAIKNNWPTQAGVPAYYGDVGKRQTLLALPYPMRLAWDRTKTVTRISLHEKVVASAGRVLGRALEHYGEQGIKDLGLDLFGGSLAVRKIRGGSAWSMHSWGIAIDFDPERNQLRWGRDKAKLAGKAAGAFWALWEEEGWVSLGRARNYDWMHVQAARL